MQSSIIRYKLPPSLYCAMAMPWVLSRPTEHALSTHLLCDIRKMALGQRENIVCIFLCIQSFIEGYFRPPGTAGTDQHLLPFCNTNRPTAELKSVIVECWVNHHYSWCQLSSKVENISKGSLDSIPSPSVKIQIMCRKVCLRWKGKTMSKLLKAKSLLTSPNNVLPYYSSKLSC